MNWSDFLSDCWCSLSVTNHCRAMPSLSGRPRHVGRHLAPPRECRQNSEFRSDSFWIFCIFVIGFIYEFDKRLALIRFYWFFNDFFHKFNIINYEFRSDSLWGFYVFFIGFIYEFDKRFALICFHWFAYDFFHLYNIILSHKVFKRIGTAKDYSDVTLA